jgi:16S rRNA (cytidine1402-2'-O)-methyltransferase
VANTSTKSTGTLYIVATPIGNLGDIGRRAADVLAAADLVAAEDTRRAGKLLAHLGIDKALLSLHEHNEDAQAGRLIAALAEGRDVALVSDAGTPLISDPGLGLVRDAAAAGIAVVAVPGPSAVTAALSVAGLATDRFAFEGFLPRKAGQRRARLGQLRTEARTLVFFEAVHRVEAMLSDLREVFGDDRPAVIARELSKLHEQVVRGPLAGLTAGLGSTIPLRGEFVIVVAGAGDGIAAADEDVLRVYGLVAAELPPARAVALSARICGRSRNEVYALTRTR